MKIKNPNKICYCEFWMDDPRTGQPFVVPAEGKAKSLDQLAMMVVKQMRQFDKEFGLIDGQRYSDAARREAEKMKITFSVYIRKLVEHQICLRSPDLCYNDGFGDLLHGVSGQIDKAVERSPAVIRKAMTSATRLATKMASGKSSTTLRGCSTCGGTRSYNPKSNNIGRAGRLNRK